MLSSPRKRGSSRGVSTRRRQLGYPAERRDAANLRACVASWILAFARMTGARVQALATNRGSSAPVAFGVTFRLDLKTIGWEYWTSGIT
jgi:hypothetical protein